MTNMSHYGSSMNVPPMPSGSTIPGVRPGTVPINPVSGVSARVPATVPFREQSYIENILRMNRGKVATVYTTYENNTEWNALVFRGIIEEAGRDHLILADPDTGMRYLLRMLNVDYITFEEEIAYTPPPLPESFMIGAPTS